jgi:hypothetical protein
LHITWILGEVYDIDIDIPATLEKTMSGNLVVYSQGGGVSLWKRHADKPSAELVEVKRRPRARIRVPMNDAEDEVPPGGKRVLSRGRWITLDAEGARYWDESLRQIAAVKEIRTLIEKHFGEDEATWWCRARHDRQRAEKSA